MFRSRDGGITWDRQAVGTQADLNGVIFADGQKGWIFGLLGTILHTTDGGATWKPQESAPYGRYPAPWFFLAMALSIPLFAWATAPERKPKAIVDDIVSSDAPVESVEDDRLGQRALIERLTNFLTNQNTAPPLVISLQAPWGMGKSSMMRMLEANLRNNRAAVTVWFNAWHHQKEDQLLAYLLETVQRQAVPQWLSRTGVSFRLDLIRVRLFDKARRDRLAMVLAAIGFVALRVLNYLRLVAARTGQAETDQGQRLRGAHAEFDKTLVGMAVHDKSAALHSPADVRKFYEEQCAVFGLDASASRPDCTQSPICPLNASSRLDLGLIL